MKMRFTGFLAFALLSISILSYGVNGSVFADSHDPLPVNIISNQDIFSNGATVTITGNLKNYDPLSQSAGAVDVIEEEDIPDEYFIEVITKKLDKKRILQELRDGVRIPGVRLASNSYVRGLK